MPNTKEDYISELVNLCFKIDDVLQQQQEKTERLTRMGQLARMGLKSTNEFKELEREFQHPQVTGASEELCQLRKIITRLRKYKF